jgi:hypothetical protein
VVPGGEPFIQNVKVRMGGMALGSNDQKAGGSFRLKEDQYLYIADFDPKKSDIDAYNTYAWDQNFENADT